MMQKKAQDAIGSAHIHHPRLHAMMLLFASTDVIVNPQQPSKPSNSQQEASWAHMKPKFFVAAKFGHTDQPSTDINETKWSSVKAIT